MAESPVDIWNITGLISVPAVRTQSDTIASKKHGHNLLFYDFCFDYGLVFTYGSGRFGPAVADKLFNREHSGSYRKLATVRAPYTLGGKPNHKVRVCHE